MNDLTPLLLLFAITNKKGFNNIKNAIEAADGFNSKLSNITNMFSMIPNLGGLLNQHNTHQESEQNYIDTLKNISDILSK